MQTLAEIRAMLEQRGLRPRHALGQNFLIDHNLIHRLIDASGVVPGDLILEVGPGTGALTAPLLERGCEVVAGELDDDLASMLDDDLAPRFPGRLTVVRGDCLAGKREIAPAILAALGGRAFALVANLPYNAATPLMLTLLVQHPACRSMAVTIQKEVVDRLTAGPGDDAYGAISVVAQCLSTVRRIAVLPPECFWPRPGVTSAMVSLRRLDTPATDDASHLADFCQAVFAQRRKQLGPTLRRLGHPVDALPPEISPTVRVEQLSPTVIAALAAACRPR